MAKKINYSDIVDIESFKVLLETLNTVEKKLKDILEMSGKKMSGNANNYSEIKKQVEAVNEATKAVEQLTEVEKQQKATEAALQEATKESIRLKKLELQANQAAEGSYNKIKAEYDAVKLKLDAMGTAQRQNTVAGQQLIAKSKELYAAMSALKNETGKQYGQLGKFKEAANLASMSLGEMKREMMQLRQVTFTGKSEAEVKALKQRIGDLMDAMGDLKSQMQVMGTENAAVMVGGLKFIAAGVEGVVGSLSLFGVESKQVEEMQKKLLALMAVTQALSEIEDMVSSGKLKAIAIRIKEMAITAADNIQKWISVTATNAQARAEANRAVMTSNASMATKAAATAQWGWNAALSAAGGPIFWIIGLVAALGTGLYFLIKAQDKSEQQLIAWNKSIERSAKYTDAQKKKIEELAESYLDLTNRIKVANKEMTQSEYDALKVTSNTTKSKLLLRQGLEYELKLIDDEEMKRRQEIKNQLISSSSYEARQAMLAPQYAKLEEDAQLKRTLVREKYKKINEDINKVKEKELELLKAEESGDKKTAVIKRDLLELQKATAKELDISILQNDRLNQQSKEADKSIKDRTNGIDLLNKQLAEGTINIFEYMAAASQLGIELQEKIREERKKQLAEEQLRREKALEALDSYLKAVSEKQQRALDRDVDNSKRHQDLLREIAARGSEDAKDNLAFEEANQRKLELKKEKALQRQKQIELGLAVMKSYSKNLEAAGGDSTKALGQTIRDATILAAFIKALPAFEKGTEDTGEFDKSGKLAVIHPHERILTKEQNQLTSGLTNWELANAASLYKKGIDTINPTNWQTNEQIIAKFDELKDAINNKPSLTGSEYDGVTNSIITIIEKGNSISRNHKRLSRLG